MMIKNILKGTLRLIFCMVSVILLFVLRLVYANNIGLEDIRALFEQPVVSGDLQYAEEIREGMLAKKESIRINYRGTKEDNMKEKALDILDVVFETDGSETPNDADYLEYTYKGVTADVFSLMGIYQITYHFEYLQSAEETMYVDEEVDKVLMKLKLEDADDYHKVKKIHDYLVKTLDYDKSLSNATPYQAIKTGKATCQGYALLFYRMAVQAGVPCRIIGGTADGEPHAWNIVKLDGLWYNIDCTWDDPVGDGADKNQISHMFFLKPDNDNTFMTHIRDSRYQSMEFTAEHEMAEKSYVRKKK